MGVCNCNWSIKAIWNILFFFALSPNTYEAFGHAKTVSLDACMYPIRGMQRVAAAREGWLACNRGARVSNLWDTPSAGFVSQHPANMQPTHVRRVRITCLCAYTCPALRTTVALTAIPSNSFTASSASFVLMVTCFLSFRGLRTASDNSPTSLLFYPSFHMFLSARHVQMRFKTPPLLREYKRINSISFVSTFIYFTYSRATHTAFSSKVCLS